MIPVRVLLVLLLALVMALVFLGLGVVCLFWRDELHEFAERMTEKRGLGLGPYSPFRHFLRSDSYRTHVLISGVLLLVSGIVVLAAVIHAVVAE